jgi:hypothetical protein
MLLTNLSDRLPVVTKDSNGSGPVSQSLETGHSKKCDAKVFAI